MNTRGGCEEGEDLTWFYREVQIVGAPVVKNSMFGGRPPPSPAPVQSKSYCLKGVMEAKFVAVLVFSHEGLPPSCRC
jgi:hypothetical protein